MQNPLSLDKLISEFFAKILMFLRGLITQYPVQQRKPCSHSESTTKVASVASVHLKSMRQGVCTPQGVKDGLEPRQCHL